MAQQFLNVITQVEPYKTETFGVFQCSYTEQFPVTSCIRGLAIVQMNSTWAIVHTSGMLFFDNLTELEAFSKRRRLLHLHSDWTDCAGFDGTDQAYVITAKCGHILEKEGMTTWSL